MNLIPCADDNCYCHKSNFNELMLTEIEKYNTDIDEIREQTSEKIGSNNATRELIIMALQKTIEID